MFAAAAVDTCQHRCIAASAAMVEKRETAREGLFHRREMIKFGVMDTKQDRTVSNDQPDDNSQGQPLSLHQRILGDVEGRILSGEWPPGHRIPFEHELTEQYDCSRMTVNKALTELVKRGLIERRRKSGSYVTFPQVQSAVMEIHDVKLEVQSLGLDYSFRWTSERFARWRAGTSNAWIFRHRRGCWM